jgi:monooxygenase
MSTTATHWHPVAGATASNVRAVANPVFQDVLIVGAGLSGIGAAYHLSKDCPNLSYTILEARESMGGTWDLFRYPGIRSDSDMFTFGFSFRPWASNKALSPGGMILDYIRDTAKEFGIDKSIRFGHKVVSAAWDSATARWTVTVRRGSGEQQEEIRLTCRFLYMCSGYYDYDAGHAPQWDGMDQFNGRIVHPQFWPTDLDYQNKRVVVIGSGATAVTLVPSMVDKAQHVTMLQRSPTYILSIPGSDVVADVLRRVLPAGLAHRIIRAKNVGLMIFMYNVSKRLPTAVRHILIALAQRQSGGNQELKNLTPRYNPWDQRLCLVPDSDLFKALRTGRASIETDEIASFAPDGLQLKSGKTMPADIVITATGLKIKLVGGMSITVDGKPVDLADTVWYKGMMFSGVPNLASSFGYTNASWTLKAELIAKYVCRVLNRMDAAGFDTCVTRADGEVHLEQAVELSSGYIQRAAKIMPKQGAKRPWKVYQNYVRDIALFRFGKLDDGAMHFERRRKANAPAGQAELSEVNT